MFDDHPLTQPAAQRRAGGSRGAARRVGATRQRGGHAAQPTAPPVGRGGSLSP